MKKLLLASAVIVGLSGCAQSYQPNEYSMSELNMVTQVENVKILRIKEVVIKNDTGKGGDAGVGALAGGLLGQVIGHNSLSTMIGAGVGAAAGGITGAMHKDTGVTLTYVDTDGVTKNFTEMGNPKWFKRGMAEKEVGYDNQKKAHIRIHYNNKPVEVAKK
ncbi:glycine zipper domain-containing protein [Vibrio profundum]|uniref:hypothetical protein n=1 Tax=Vibrio profundum TaxID=2910247 RepID=UPI003D0A6854